MSFTVANLKYLEPTTLRQWFQQGGISNSGNKFIIIDVRDNDYIGGHIKNSINITSSEISINSNKILKLAKDNNAKDIIFHCALSQQRGPSSALKFSKFLNDYFNSNSNNNIKSDDFQFLNDLNIWILKGGFVKWQELYGDDNSVTSDYDKKIWEFGY
ncbi:hydrolase activity protein [[Candida] boidinii]|nr:hydrolase activity protein [[Candida] boidinii]